MRRDQYGGAGCTSMGNTRHNARDAATSAPVYTVVPQWKIGDHFARHYMVM